MKFLTFNDGKNVLEVKPGDPTIDEIKRIFWKNGLKLTEDVQNEYFNITIRDGLGLLNKFFIMFVTKQTYIIMQVDEAARKLNVSLDELI